MTDWLASLSPDEFMTCAVIAGFVGNVALRGAVLFGLVLYVLVEDREEPRC